MKTSSQSEALLSKCLMMLRAMRATWNRAQALAHVLLRTVSEVSGVIPSHRGGNWGLGGHRNFPRAPKPVKVSGWVRDAGPARLTAKPEPTLWQGNMCSRRREEALLWAEPLTERANQFIQVECKPGALTLTRGKVWIVEFLQMNKSHYFQGTTTLAI